MSLFSASVSHTFSDDRAGSVFSFKMSRIIAFMIILAIAVFNVQESGTILIKFIFYFTISLSYFDAMIISFSILEIIRSSPDS